MSAALTARRIAAATGVRVLPQGDRWQVDGLNHRTVREAWALADRIRRRSVRPGTFPPSGMSEVMAVHRIRRR